MKFEKKNAVRPHIAIIYFCARGLRSSLNDFNLFKVEEDDSLNTNICCDKLFINHFWYLL